MAFGFFKRSEKVDSIFFNGSIHLMDSNSNLAESIACKDGKIFAIGDYDDMSNLIGEETEQIDLSGKHLYPGFIDVHSSPVMRAFEGMYLDLSGCQTTQEILDSVSQWALCHPDCEMVFGYGYTESLKPNDEENESLDFLPSSSVLSQACPDLPVVLLCQSTVSLWVNEAAAEIIATTSEEEMVPVITVPYVLNLFIPFDFDALEEAVNHQTLKMAEKGITSVLNLGTPDYLEDIYQDALMGLYNESVLMQKFYGSYLLNRPLNPKALLHRLMSRRTNCIEMGGLLNAETLYLYLNNQASPAPFTQDSLDEILEATSNRGFHIFIEATYYSDLLLAYNGLEHVRNKGFNNPFSIASPHTLSSDDESQLIYSSSAVLTWQTNLLDGESVLKNGASTEEFLELYTRSASEILGKTGGSGTLALGEAGDFAIFEEDVLRLDEDAFKNRKASMTVLNGHVVYDSMIHQD